MSIRIFLVEDHPVMRGIYVDLLDCEPDFELCGITESAEACLDVLPDTHCNILVTDLSLPGMDGIALIKQVRADRPGFPAIVVSAHEASKYEDLAREAGAGAYVGKADLARDLAPTIRRVAAGPQTAEG